MAASTSAVTDTPGLIAFLYRADWRQLCLSATFSVRAEDPRATRIPGEDGGQPPGQAAEGDERDEGDPKETWRLATEAPEAPDVYEEEDDDEDYADDVPPHWRDSRSRVLIAPGERYRIEDARPVPDRGMILIRDRESLWRVGPDEAVLVPELGLTAALMDLLDPSWLISYFDLELAGAAEAAGRPAYRVTAAPRPVTTSTRDERFDRVDVLVDAEFGILLRCEAYCGGQLIEATGLRSLALDPAEAGDPGRFRPPAGLPRTDPYADAGTIFGTSGPGWRVIKTGAKAAAVAVAYGIRRASRAQPAPAGTSPPVPQPAGRPAAGEAAGVSDDLVNLLHRTGLPPQRFAAGMRKWSDSELVLRGVAAYRAAQPPGLRGVLGPQAVWDALADAPPQTSFQTARLRVSLPGKYRIDYLAGDWQDTTLSACDGTRQWRVYPNRVVTEPARPLHEDWSDLVDPAWLLASCWRLSAAGPQDVGGRPGWRIWADRADGNDLRDIQGAQMYPRAAVVVDSELGIVLQLAFLVDDRPAVCFELHDITVPPEDDAGAFGVEIPPGTRVVEASSVFDYLDIPRPVKAAWTAGKAGLAGASAVAGWLSNREPDS